MFKALVTALTLLSVTSQPIATNCDTNSVFKVEQIYIEYEAPPVNSTLTVAYTVPEQIEDGLAKFTCTLNGIPILNEQKPLCQDTTCPITVGFHNDSNPFETALTSGTLSCTTKWLAADSSVLRCIKIVESS
jgi:ML domain